MNILDAKVEWWERYANTPSIKILTDHIPTLDEYEYETRNGIYYAELNGFVSFFYYTAPDNGYGGASFKLKMKDGSTKTLRGPWSSNSQHVNSVGFGPCVECNLTDKSDVMRLGYTFMAGAITLDMMKLACTIANVYCVFHNGFWTPSLHPTRLIKHSSDFDGKNPRFTEYVDKPNGGWGTIKHDNLPE